LKDKKKIIFSTYDDINNPFYAGGGARAIAEITKRLAAFFEITVITGNYKGAKNEEIHGVAYQRIGPDFLGPKLGQLAYAALLPSVVKQQTFDVWIESFTPPFSTACLQKFTKKPVIGLVHMLASEDMERKYKLPFHLVENAGLKTYNHFIVLSNAFQKKIERVNKHASIVVIPNGIPERESAPSKDTDDYILFLGRLEFDQKGLDLLLDAYHTIAGKTSTRLVIAGSGLAKDERLVANKIDQLGLQQKVELIGRVDGEKKENLLKKCSLVAVPSRFETFGVVPLEAMSYGKPVVTFAIEGFEWLPKEAALQVAPFDAKAFGQAMHKILADKELYHKLSLAGVKAAKGYSWEKIVSQFKEVINSVIV
jgi:phosphatidyl-myo-inositol alpha-mannosyltransferase